MPNSSYEPIFDSSSIRYKDWDKLFICKLTLLGSKVKRSLKISFSVWVMNVG
jgi:hypothetical protein